MAVEPSRMQNPRPNHDQYSYAARPRSLAKLAS
jgi:hypothetical protein